MTHEEQALLASLAGLLVLMVLMIRVFSDTPSATYVDDEV